MGGELTEYKAQTPYIKSNAFFEIMKTFRQD